MSETVVFEFKSFQRVHIREIDADGFVHSRLANAEGQNEYQVRYWLDGKRCDDWFYAFELEGA